MKYGFKTPEFVLKAFLRYQENTKRRFLENTVKKGYVSVTELLFCPYAMHRKREMITVDSYLLRGTLLHFGLAQLLKTLGNIETEVTIIDEELGVTGVVDAIYNKEEVIEFKTIASNNITPQDNHLRQLYFYMSLVRLRKGRLIYFVTDKSDWLTVKIEVGRGFLEEVREEIRERVKKFWTKAKEPYHRSECYLCDVNCERRVKNASSPLCKF